MTKMSKGASHRVIAKRPAKTSTGPGKPTKQSKPPTWSATGRKT